MTVNELGFRLLNDFQRDFPLTTAPFGELARHLAVSENAVLAALGELRREGKVARVGAVFAPKRIGASTLAAIAVPAARLTEVAETVNRFPEVNHNYEREHRYNLWFVATAGSHERLQATLAAIERAAGEHVIRLPLVHEYHIDLGFPLDGRAPTAGARRAASACHTPLVLSERERRSVVALQEGLPLDPRPFSVLAARIGCHEEELLARLRSWCEQGVIKRFGVIVRHHELGYTANAMLVHDVPDDTADQVGRQLAGEAGVNLCYRRQRMLPEWRYNLFCMIHGRARAEVEARISDLRSRLRLTDYAHEVLFSLTRYKQSGARYA